MPGACTPSSLVTRMRGCMRRESPGALTGAAYEEGLVGMAGFEPTTTCTPSRCATRLRYIPTRRRRSDSTSIIPFQESQDFAELLADLAQRVDALGARGVGRGR